MTDGETPLSTSRTFASIVPVWLAAAIGGVLVAIWIPIDERFGGLSLSLAVCTLIAFAVQLSVRRREGFVSRVTASIVGAVVVTAVASIVIAITLATTL